MEKKGFRIVWISEIRVLGLVRYSPMHIISESMCLVPWRKRSLVRQNVPSREDFEGLIPSQNFCYLLSLSLSFLMWQLCLLPPDSLTGFT